MSLARHARGRNQGFARAQSLRSTLVYFSKPGRQPWALSVLPPALTGFDATPRQENGTGYRMGRRIFLILGALVAATIYFRLRPGA